MAQCKIINLMEQGVPLDLHCGLRILPGTVYIRRGPQHTWYKREGTLIVDKADLSPYVEHLYQTKRVKLEDVPDPVVEVVAPSPVVVAPVVSKPPAPLPVVPVHVPEALKPVVPVAPTPDPASASPQELPVVPTDSSKG